MVQILQQDKWMMSVDAVSKWLRRSSVRVFPIFQGVSSRKRGRRANVIRVVWAVAAAFSAVPSVSAQQQPETLQEKLDQLKRQYDATTRDLEQRIAALEQQIEQQNQKEKEAREKAKEGTVSAVELAAEQAAQEVVTGGSGDVGSQYQGQLPSEPTYDLLREADQEIAKLQEEMRAFEFHGYFRSGYGLNGVGGQQVAFAAPGGLVDQLHHQSSERGAVGRERLKHRLQRHG